MGQGRRFHLIRKLGSGAFGAVYLAELESLGGFRKQVALKLLRPELGDGSDAGRRLRDEARLLGRIRHPNIVQVDDLVRLDGRYAVVMELVPGHDLEALLEATGAPLPPRAALQVCEAVARALAAAHGGTTGIDAPPVVHRDIKPSNVRVSAEGLVKVLDFGIARADFEEREARTERVRYGSVAYMSPERLLGEEETAAGDVYALVCVLFELLLGERYGRAELAPERFEAQRTEALDRLSRHLDDALPEAASAELLRVAHAGLAYDPGRRPDAAELAATFRRAAAGAEGDDLTAWASRVVPALDATLGLAGEPAGGVLSEETVAEPGVRGGSKTPTLVPTIGQAMPTTAFEADPVEPEPDPPRPMFGVVLGAALVTVLVTVALLGLGMAWIWPSAAPPPGPLVVVEPAPEPPVDPAPPPEPILATPSEPVAAPPVEPAAPGPSPAAPVLKQAIKATVEPAVEPAVEPVVEATAERLRAVKVTVEGASEVMARCGDREASGASSALLRDLPPGLCTVRARLAGELYESSLQVDRARGVTCALDGGALTCR